MLVTEHGVWVRERYISISDGESSLFEKRFLMDLSRFIARINCVCADVISPVTNFNRRWELPSGVRGEQIETISNGADPALFVPKRKPPETSGRPVVVAAARVFPLKDLETMIRAAALVRGELPDVEFRVYGSLDADPDYVARCRGLIAQLELEQTYKLAGHHTRPAELYAEGDVTALSSMHLRGVSVHGARVDGVRAIGRRHRCRRRARGARRLRGGRAPARPPAG